MNRKDQYHSRYSVFCTPLWRHIHVVSSCTGNFLFGREKLPHGTYVDLDSLLIGGCHDPNIVSDY